MEGEVGENQGTRFKNCVCYTVLLCLYTVLLMLVPRCEVGDQCSLVVTPGTFL